MFDLLIKAMSGGSVEERYLGILAAIDQIETATHSLVEAGAMTKETAIEIAELKQKLIEEFASANRSGTLAEILGKYSETEQEQ